MSQKTTFVRIPPTISPDSLNQDEINIYVPVGTSTLDPDKKLVRIHWLNDSNVPTETWAFKKSSIEIPGASTAELRGSESDTGAAVATRLGNDTELTQDGAVITEFDNNGTARCAIGYLGGPIMCYGDYGGFLKMQQIAEEEVTIAAAAYTDSTLQLPAGCVAMVGTRTTVAIPGTSTYSVGIAGDTSCWGSGVGSTANSTNLLVALTSGLGVYVGSSAIEVRITPDTTPSAATGKVRIHAMYFLLQPPTL